LFPGISATLFSMAGTFQRLSLYFLAIALAVAPLRGTLARIPLSAASSEHHCTQMAYGIHLPGNPVDSQALPGSRDSGHDCNRSCKGTCCGNACTCVPAAAAISASLWTAPLLTTAARHAPLFPGFTQRSLNPPFRPPVSVTS
jgi:hypothetical protein